MYDALLVPVGVIIAKKGHYCKRHLSLPEAAGAGLRKVAEKRFCETIESAPRVAEHVGVGRAPGARLGQAVRHHARPVLLRQRHHLQRHPRVRTHLAPQRQLGDGVNVTGERLMLLQERLTT